MCVREIYCTISLDASEMGLSEVSLKSPFACRSFQTDSALRILKRANEEKSLIAGTAARKPGEFFMKIPRIVPEHAFLHLADKLFMKSEMKIGGIITG